MTTLSELRKTLLDTILKVKSGEVKTDQGLTMCALAKSVIDLTRLQMDQMQFEWAEPIDFFKDDVLLLDSPPDQIDLTEEYKPDEDTKDWKNMKDDLKKNYRH